MREYKGQVESKELENRKTIFQAVNPQCNHRSHHNLFSLLLGLQKHFKSALENNHSEENITIIKSDRSEIISMLSGDSCWMEAEEETFSFCFLSSNEDDGGDPVWIMI